MPNTVYGIGGLVNVPPGPISGNGAPANGLQGQLGQQYFDRSTSPPTEYIFNGQSWAQGGNEYATDTDPGIVTLSLDIATDYPSDELVPTVTATKDYVDGIAIAGAPVSTETTAGIGQLATDAEAVAGTPSTGLLALFVTPSNLTPVFAAPPAIGGTTPAAGAFTNISATGVGTGNILTSNTASNFSTTGAGIDVTIDSAAGRVILNGEEAAANAITLLTAAGGIDVDAALQINIASSQNAVDAIRIVASAGGIDIDAVGAATEDINITNTGGSIVLSATESAADSVVIQSTAGGIDILATGAAAGEDIDISTSASVNITATENNAGAIIIRTNGGTSERVTLLASQGTGADSINLESTAGGITLSAALATADAINLAASAGGVDIDGALQVNIASSQNAVDAIRIVASAGGIDIDAVGAATEDINITNTGGSVYIGATESAADSIKIESTAGGIDIFASGAAAGEDIDIVATGSSVNISATENTADSIVITSTAGGIDIFASGAAAGEDIDIVATGSSVNIESTEDAALAVYLHANGGTSETIRIRADQGTGVASVDILSDVGGITLTSGLASADAINLSASAGGVDIDGALQVNIASSQNAADSIVITSSVGGIDILAAGAAAGEDIDIVATGSSVNITSTESAADSIVITSSAGGIDILASGAAAGEDIDIIATGSSVNINSTENTADSIVISSTNGGIDITAAGASAGEDIDITATGSSINIVATEAAANAIVLNASNAAGGVDISTGGGSIDLSSAGAVTMVAGTDSQAGDTCTVNKNVFAATFTGFTTAAAASQVFNITNSTVGTTSQVIVTLCNEGANDAQMSVMRVKRTAGQLQVTAKNNGAAALNGNVTITGWVIG